jgi:GDPmannose 4,6-dehydratase
VEIDKRYFRPAEVDLLLGDSSKIRSKLGWKPKVDFKELVKMMVESDMKVAKKEQAADGVE